MSKYEKLARKKWQKIMIKEIEKEFRKNKIKILNAKKYKRYIKLYFVPDEYNISDVSFVAINHDGYYFAKINDKIGIRKENKIWNILYDAYIVVARKQGRFITRLGGKTIIF